MTPAPGYHSLSPERAPMSDPKGGHVQLSIVHSMLIAFCVSAVVGLAVTGFLYLAGVVS